MLLDDRKCDSWLPAAGALSTAGFILRARRSGLLFIACCYCYGFHNAPLCALQYRFPCYPRASRAAAAPASLAEHGAARAAEQAVESSTVVAEKADALVSKAAAVARGQCSKQSTKILNGLQRVEAMGPPKICEVRAA